MGRQKIQNRETRKITRIGSASLGVTLPMEELRELKWREGRKVTVKRVRGGFLVRDWRE